MAPNRHYVWTFTVKAKEKTAQDFANFWVILRFIIFFPGPESPPGLSRAENLYMQKKGISEGVSKLTTNASPPFFSRLKTSLLNKKLTALSCILTEI
jgi:hypothetical protein